MNDDEIRTSLANFALAHGQNPDQVQRIFGTGGEDASIGQRASQRLDAFMRDPGWVARWQAGDLEAHDQWNCLTVVQAWQQGRDREAQYAASLEGIERANAEQAAADKAEADAEAAADQSSSTQQR
jgi:hypothetical protein